MEELLSLHREKFAWNAEQTKIIVSTFQSLRDYFFADGNGLPSDYLDQTSKTVVRIVQLISKNTKDLMDEYLSLKSRELDLVEGGITHQQVRKILEARQDDKDAVAFLNEMKQNDSVQPGQKTDQQKVQT